MAFSNGYIFSFATAVCVVCSLAVASTATGLRDIQNLNKKRDLQTNILGALGLPEDGHRPLGEEIDRLWEARIAIEFVDPNGKVVDEAAADLDGDGDADEEDVELARDRAKESGGPPELLSVYLRKDGADIGAYGIPVYGMGLWGPISGYLAVERDGETLMGATFAAPKETPGLGAEIMQPKFLDQWDGKKLFNSAGKAQAIAVAKGAAKDRVKGDALNHWVDGVSGATITCRGVTAMLADGVRFYEPYLLNIRNGS